MKNLALASLLILILSLIPASAQFTFYSPNSFLNSSLDQYFKKRWTIHSLRVAGKHQAADALEGKSPSEANQTPAEPAPPERYSLSASTYRKSQASIAPERLLAEISSLSAAERQELMNLYNSLLQSYEELLVSNNEQRLRDNVAGSAAFAIAAAKLVLSSEELSPDSYEALVQDLNSLLVSNESFRALSDGERQYLSETLQIYGGLAMALQTQGQEEGDIQMAEQGRELARSLMGQLFDCPPEDIQFTESGVVLP